MAFTGANARLKRVLRKARSGEKIKIGILGGSVTAGHGVSHERRWMTLYGEWWKAIFPQTEIQVINGAVPATTTEYYLACFAEHIDEDIDVVVIEMAINDQRWIGMFCLRRFVVLLVYRIEPLARSYEYLLRVLMELPNRPAVLNLQVCYPTTFLMRFLSDKISR